MGGLTGAAEEISDRAGEIGRAVSPFEISFSGVGGTNTYFRCFYLAISPLPPLLKAHSLATDLFPSPTRRRPFEPHLSLVYGDLDSQTKTSLERQVKDGYPQEIYVSKLELYATLGPVNAWRRLNDIPLIGK